MRSPFTKEFDYYGKRMRPYFKLWGFAVSEDGKTVLRHYENDFGSGIIAKRPPSRLTVQTDKDGRCFVRTQDHGVIMVDVMVAAAFCQPCPSPNSMFELVHKDGAQSNCHYKNLEWQRKQSVPQSTLHTTKNKVKLTNGLTVHKDGSVFDGIQELNHQICIFDSDTNLFFAIQPIVRYRRPNQWNRIVELKTNIDSLMAGAGYVGGEKYDFTNPRILHKDYDWLNFDSTNLEWCDASDQRYLDYAQKQTEDMKEWNIANNKDFPDCYK